MIQNSYTLIISFFLLFVSIVFLTVGLKKRRKVMLIFSLLGILIFGAYITLMYLIRLNGGM